MRIRLQAFLLPGLLLGGARAQAPAPAPAPAMASAPASFFPHPSGRWYLAGQANYIFQQHGPFPATFSGPNSFGPGAEDALSRVWTLYTGLQLNRHTEALFDLEETGGQGLSSVLGMAGFPNLDAVRNPELSTAPYVARALLHAYFGFGSASQTATPGALSTFARLPERRLELWVGKYSLVDFFDLNSVGSDSHLQFMNWTIDNNGAYDYAADTRGYTFGAVAVYSAPQWSLRFGEALMPKVANGIALQWDLTQAHAENLELDWSPPAFRRRPLTLRLLAYGNTANMGVYRQAINNALAGITPVPEITAHAPQPRRKLGLGFSLEEAITSSLHIFGRAGWADGRYESFAYTEAEQSVSAGATLSGDRWGRPADKLGVAWVQNGISGDHRRYLALGGLGFLLGDGGLRYAHERVTEAFYNFYLGRGLSFAPDVQYAVAPGYNRARGPVWITGARVHMDF